ncbi:DUF2267 domain-containing protein [Nocardia otitidiscaviarum]|uniref:DUF2267 domain-containing protein n=1 Tax=Nocardia otitidiscaviarum TaxID=1823 RepID=UPI0018949899|nr:DUF2267 domain-containing protein [Nocardia otitidiscaviarum]MBF6241099.1 DUF2267 domain-containing protein [Nocardia otitidiscaviarum]
MSHQSDPLAPAVHTAHEWLNAIADGLDTYDKAFAHRAMRAWLHTVRDRIGVNAAAHLSAQLPELLRGIFYEGWMPAHVPVPHDVASFLTQFAREAGVSRDEAAALAGVVTDSFAGLFSPGQLDHVLAQLPVALRHVLLGADLSGVLAGAAVLTQGETDRVDELEVRVAALRDAVAVLARGLEDLPGGPSPEAARAAQHAHRILLAEGLSDTRQQPV